MITKDDRLPDRHGEKVEYFEDNFYICDITFVENSPRYTAPARPKAANAPLSQ